jgi:hypothetical protein
MVGVLPTYHCEGKTIDRTGPMPLSLTRLAGPQDELPQIHCTIREVSPNRQTSCIDRTRKGPDLPVYYHKKTRA